MDSATKTTYRMTINGIYTGGLQHSFSTDDGWTDEFALAVTAALNALTWPAGGGFSMEKIVTSTTDATVDLAVAPLAFV